MKNRLIKIFIALFTISIIFNINVTVHAEENITTEAGANEHCKAISGINVVVKQQNCKKDNLCEWQSGLSANGATAMCIAKSCESYGTSSCPTWCTQTNPNQSISCYTRKSCKDYADEGSYVYKDDYGTICEFNEDLNPILLITYFSGSIHNPVEKCKMLEKYKELYKGKNPFDDIDCNTLTGGERTTCNELKGSTFDEQYERQCVCNNKCTNGTICVGNNICECPLGSVKSGDKCIKSGGMGSSNKYCIDGYDYVKNALIQTCESQEDISCDASDCNVISTKVIEESVKLNGIHYYDKGTEKEYAANRYGGTCNNIGVDTFCIDPASAFDEKGYLCHSSLNYSSDTDKGYIKIYQSSLSKYKNQYLNNTTDNNKYMALHFAFRLYTYYKGMGQDINNNAKALYFSKSSYAIANNSIINEVAPNDGYFFIKEASKNMFASVSRTDNDSYDVYRNALNLFKEAIGTYNIWLNPLEFKRNSVDINEAGEMIANITLSGLDKIRNSEFNDKFVKDLGCKNCTILTPINSNLLDYNQDSITFDIKVNDPTEKYVLQVKYYDKRDGKNIIISTKHQNSAFQRLLLVSREPRQFIHQQTFDNELMGCRVASNGKLYGGNNNKALSVLEFANACCLDMSYDKDLKEAFKNVIKNDRKYYYITDAWIDNGCLQACNPNNTTNSCTATDGEYKDIVISDFTDGTSAGLNYQGMNHTCAVGTTDNTGASYLKMSNDYCKVYCIEEYHFTVPTSLGKITGIKYGRYFNLNVKAKGSRTCFTDPTTDIDYDKFKEDYNSTLNNVKNAIRTLNDWNYLVNNLKTLDIKTNDKSCTKPGSGNHCENESWWNGSSCVHGKQSDENCHNNRYTAINATTCTAPALGGSTDQSCGTYKSYYYDYSVYNDTGTLSNGSCDTNSCKASSGSRGDIEEQIINKRNNAYKNVTDLLTILNSIRNAYNSCSTFKVDLEYDPIVKYTYEENVYMEKLGNDNYLTTLDKNSIEHNYDDSYYDDLSSREEYTGNKITDALLSIDSYKCDETSYSCSTMTETIHKNNYVHKIETASSTLEPFADWYTNAGDGLAYLKKISGNDLYLGHVLPISRICKNEEKFKYTLEFTNIGSPKSNQIGRLDNVIKNNPVSKANTNLLYDCDYRLSSCEGCETNYFYRPISLNDVFAKGINDYSPKTGLTYNRNAVDIWVSNKGVATQKEIETLSENAYTENHLQYSYTLTPTGMKNIREYNKTTDYGDFNLKCTNGNNCKSEFLDKIKENVSNEFNGVTENKRNDKFISYEDGTPWK